MPAHAIDVRYVADLARLQLDHEEVRTFEAQLEAILGYVAKLSELDVAAIEPTAHPAPVYDRIADDQPLDGLEPAALLDNAPDRAAGQVRVPKVVADA
jgi:aspartyl-tRNA(Asn)/glutamyl-tRNA(Gln) amidotransferase subunit C